MSVPAPRPIPKRRPTGLAFPKKYFAIVSLTIATFGVPVVSVSANSRPATRGMPIVAK